MKDNKTKIEADRIVLDICQTVLDRSLQDAQIKSWHSSGFDVDSDPKDLLTVSVLALSTACL